MQIARVMHIAMPQFERVIDRLLRGVNGPAARWTFATAVGAIRGPSEYGSLNIKECLKASRSSPRVEIASWGNSLCAEPLTSWVRPKSSVEKKPGENGRAWRGIGPSTHTRIMEITSGRAVYQQGLAATCKDSTFKAEAKAGRGIRSCA